MMTVKSLTLILILLMIASCTQSSKQEQGYTSEPDTYVADSSSAGQDTLAFNHTYESEKFNFTFDYPEDWQINESDSEGNSPIITVYKARQNESIPLPIGVHTDPEVSHVSFFPKGTGTELPYGETEALQTYNAALPVPFELDPKKTKLLFLSKGPVYLYFLKPASLPPSWSPNGFILAQIKVNNFSQECLDAKTEKLKSMENCDPLEGDKVESFGDLAIAEKEAVLKILSTVSFTEEGREKRSTGELIRLQQPKPYQTISSPVSIQGKARGSWYFEAEFPVVLTDDNHVIMSESSAQAEGNWMTEDFVPFKATLEFDPATTKNGYLILKKSNASGLPEHDRSFSIPVQFSSLD